MDERSCPQLVTIPQAAKAGLLNASALRRLVREEKIPSVKIGSRNYISWRVVNDYLAEISGESPLSAAEVDSGN